MVEYKDFDAFETDTIVATIGSYNLEFSNYKKKVADAFPNLNLHRVTPMSKLEEDEEEGGEEDDEGKGEEPM